jgi:branched-chain amino acid transport system substrate-binding protein
MRNQRVAKMALVLALSVALAACGKAGSSGSSQQQSGGNEARPIKIGVVTSVTGALAGYADQEIKGLKLGIEYATNGTQKVLGRPIEILVEDDTGSPDVGKQKAIKLLEQDKVDILQGTAATPVALQVAEVAKQYGVIFMVDPAAGDQLTTTNFNKYIFRTGGNTSQDALTGGKATVETLGKRIVHLAPDNAFGKSAQQAWDPIFTAAGGEVIKDISVPANAKDFATYLQQVYDLKPDVLMVTWAGENTLKLFQQISEMKLYDKMKVTTSIGDRASLQGLGDAAVGLRGVVRYFYTLPKNPVNDWLVAEHQKRYGAPPDIFTAGGMAAGIAIVRGIEKAGSTDAEKLIAALEGMSFEGPKGTYTFRKEDHQALQPMYFVEIVKDPGHTYPIPKLIKEFKPEETAPPVQVKR